MRRLLSRALASAFCSEAYTRLKRVKGIGPAVRWAVRMVFPPRQSTWLEVFRGRGSGLAMLVYPGYELAYLRGDHEPAVQDLIESWLRPGDVFFDVGAHMGYFTLLAARLVGPQGAAKAFEPDPENFARLTANVARNRMNWIMPVCAVVLDERKDVSFVRSSPSSSRMEGRVTADSESKADVLTLPAVTLDDYFDPRSGVAKIDVEGGELLVLKGADRFLAEGSLRWIVEAHSDKLAAGVEGVFRAAGYNCRAIHPTNQRPLGARRHIVAVRE